MVIPAVKMAFIDVPKTGTTSLTYFLHQNYRAFAKSNPDNLWYIKACSRQVSHNFRDPKGEGISYPKVRHVPLLSYYENIPDFYDYFYFTLVRHPFDRFKSFIYETLLHIYFNLPNDYFSKQSIYNKTYLDPWFLENNNTDDWMHHQCMMVINQLNIIQGKTFNKVNLCSIPLHLWPQNYFLTLKTATPYNLRILKLENLKKWENDFKLEISQWSGINVTNSIIPHIDPITYNIFLTKTSSANKLTIPHNQDWELKIFHDSDKHVPDLFFEEKFPPLLSLIAYEMQLY
jgi:hypothetical protein